MISISRSQLKRLINNNSLQKNVVYDFWIASHLSVSFMVHKSPSSDMSKRERQNKERKWAMNFMVNLFQFNFSSCFHLNMKTIFHTLLLKCKHTTMYVCQMLSYQACPKNVWYSPFLFNTGYNFFSFHIFLWKMIVGSVLII